MEMRNPCTEGRVVWIASYYDDKRRNETILVRKTAEQAMVAMQDAYENEGGHDPLVFEPSLPADGWGEGSGYAPQEPRWEAMLEGGAQASERIYVEPFILPE